MKGSEGVRGGVEGGQANWLGAWRLHTGGEGHGGGFLNEHPSVITMFRGRWACPVLGKAPSSSKDSHLFLCVL